MSGELGYTHPEDLSWLEVPQTFPAAEEEPGGGGRVVPQIRCRFIFLSMHKLPFLVLLVLTCFAVLKTALLWDLALLMFLITATKEIPEDKELLHSGPVFHQRMEGRTKNSVLLCFSIYFCAPCL